MAISADPTSLSQKIVRMLGWCHWNVSNALHMRMTSLDVCLVLWTFLKNQKRTNGCSEEVVTKTMATLWWASQTRINLNKKYVTRRHIEVVVYDEKPTHYLLETQVRFSPLYNCISLNFCITNQCNVCVHYFCNMIINFLEEMFINLVW